MYRWPAALPFKLFTMRPQKRFEMIELVIVANATGTRFNFPDLPQLRSDVTKDIVVRAIETYTVDDLTTDFNGNPPCTAAVMKLASLTLYIEGEESMFRLPLVKLHNVYAAAATQFYTQDQNQFDNLMIDWTKSYISTPTPFGIGTQFSFVFGIVYQRLAPGTMKALQAARGGYDCKSDYVGMM
jgi:hypothetical protein